MAYYKKFLPFIEAPTKRLTTQPVSGGINLSAVEQVSQGVSIKNINKKFTAVLPYLNAGNVESLTEEIVIDHAPLNDPTASYVEKTNITAEAYLKDFSQFLSPIQVGDYLPIEGALEPLVIRDEAAFTSIENPIAHKTRGSLLDGNETTLAGSDRIASFIEYEANSDFVPYEDAVDTDANGKIIIFGYVADDTEDKTRKFDDTDFHGRNLVSGSDINSALLAMTGTIDNDFRPLDSKAATSGFIYDNKEGTNSLAFGGLLR